MTRADKEEVDRRLSIFTQNDVSRRAAGRRKEGIRESLALVPPELMAAGAESGHDRVAARKHLITLAAIVCRLLEEHEDFRE